MPIIIIDSVINITSIISLHHLPWLVARGNNKAPDGVPGALLCVLLLKKVYSLIQKKESKIKS
jgi:hypothetical protein